MTRLWLARLNAPGPTRETGGIVRYFGSSVLAATAQYLPGASVCFYRHDGKLDHPMKSERAAFTVGRVESGWVHNGRLFAYFSLLPSADRVRRGLEALDRDGRLGDVGVSLAFDVEDQDLRDLSTVSEPKVEIIGFRSVLGFDLVMRPAGEGCHLVQSNFCPRTAPSRNRHEVFAPGAPS